MISTKDIYNYLTTFAPLDIQESYDNSGFLFGDINGDVSRVMLALDVRTDVIEEALEKGCQLIISHHPLIFGSLKCILAEDPTGAKILKLAKNNISVLSFHTNLDKVLVNKTLIRLISDKNYNKINDYMWSGEMENITDLHDYIIMIKKNLNCSGIRYYNSGKKVSKVACIGGAGGSDLITAYENGCDTYITADIKYNYFLDAKELKINLIDANHFDTENPVISELHRLLQEKFPNTEFIISKYNNKVIEYA